MIEPGMIRILWHGALLAGVLGGWCGEAVAQVPYPPYWGRPRVRPAQQPEPVDPFAPARNPLGYRPGFEGLQAVYPDYPGYPTYPQGLGPQLASPGAAIPEWKPGPQPLRGMRGWPMWMQEALTAEGRVVTPERAILGRLTDRVWFFAPDDNAFIPLSYWDKFRIAASGAMIEVRNKGEFLLAMHDAGQLRSIGPAQVTVTRLSPDVAEFELRSFTRMWISARSRMLRVTLPDASVLEQQSATFYLECLGQRATVYNQGPEKLVWHSRTGVVELEPARRVDLFVDRPADPFRSSQLRLEGGVRITRDGRVLAVHGDGPGGTVTWTGTRVAVPSTAVVRIDPLAGKVFPEKQE